MMAIVVALLGAFHLGATFALRHGQMAWSIAYGVAVIACGLALVVLFGRVTRRATADSNTDGNGGSDAARGGLAAASNTDGCGGSAAASNADGNGGSIAPRLSCLGTAILTLGTLALSLGIVALLFSWSFPFSWMMCVLSLAIFIDTLCLRISLSKKRN